MRMRRLRKFLRKIRGVVAGILIGVVLALVVSPILAGRTSLSWSLLRSFFSEPSQTWWIAIGSIGTATVALVAIAPLARQFQEQRDKRYKLRIVMAMMLADLTTHVVMIHCRHSDNYGDTLGGTRGRTLRNQIEQFRELWLLLTPPELGLLTKVASEVGLISDMGDVPNIEVSGRFNMLYITLLRAADALSVAAGEPPLSEQYRPGLSQQVVVATELAEVMRSRADSRD